MVEDSESERTTMVRRPSPLTSAVVHALILRNESQPPRRLTLGPVPLRIGRHPANDLVLSSPEISRQHCNALVEGGAAILSDLGSTNGVYVDGRRLDAPALLQSGARIAIGPFTLTYQRGTIDELLAAEEGEREQARAVAYIQAMLPRPLQDGAVHAEWRFQPSAQLGGDAFGYRWLDPQHFALFLLDVSGHGLGSALLAASAANMLRGPALGARADDPAAVLQILNAAFPMEDHDDLFFTLWYGVYDSATRELRYASAGHHPAYLVHNRELAPLMTRAPAIGLSAASRFVAATAKLPQQSSLHLFSDGAFEDMRPDGTPGRIGDVVSFLRDNPDPTGLFDQIRERTGRRPFEDDVSLLRFLFT